MLTDSSRSDLCPLGHRCESCGAESPGLRVVAHGVLNATLCPTCPTCPTCASSGRPPQIMLSTLERLVAAHAAHLRSRDEPTTRTRYPTLYPMRDGRTNGERR